MIKFKTKVFRPKIKNNNPKKFIKSLPFCKGQSQFLEAPLLRQAEGELKNNISQ